MRIIHLAPYCDEVGNGVVNVAVDLACKQAKAGHIVGFASGGGSLTGLLKTYEVEHFGMDFGLKNPVAIVRTLLVLRRVIKRFKPDIVHAHMVPGSLVGRILRTGSNFRLVTTVHNAPKRQSVLMGLADIVIVVSSANLTSMKRRGISERKLRIVKNGPLGSPRRSQIENPSDRIVLRRPAIVTVARLYTQKGISDLIAAFGSISAEFPEAALYLVGEGPERKQFERQAAAISSCSNRIHFVGFIRDPRLYLAQADIFVLASRSDPFPLVIPEAREAGCAIVATNVDGIPEGLDDGRAGILVPPSDPPALAEALIRLLRDPNELALWRRRSAENIGWLQMERVSKETLAVYQEVLETPEGIAVDRSTLSK
jgi:glycosyltransferase involved in cell wall biosynthesis